MNPDMEPRTQLHKETTIKKNKKYAQNFKHFYQCTSADKKYAPRKHAKNCCQAWRSDSTKKINGSNRVVQWDTKHSF